MRIVDAVKGPFYPTPPPFPTFLPEKNPNIDVSASYFAPTSEKDSGLLIEPEDPIS